MRPMRARDTGKKNEGKGGRKGPASALGDKLPSTRRGHGPWVRGANAVCARCQVPAGRGTSRRGHGCGRGLHTLTNLGYLDLDLDLEVGRWTPGRMARQRRRLLPAALLPLFALDRLPLAPCSQGRDCAAPALPPGADEQCAVGQSAGARALALRQAATIITQIAGGASQPTLAPAPPAGAASGVPGARRAANRCASLYPGGGDGAVSPSGSAHQWRAKGIAIRHPAETMVLLCFVLTKPRTPRTMCRASRRPPYGVLPVGVAEVHPCFCTCRFRGPPSKPWRPPAWPLSKRAARGLDCTSVRARSYVPAHGQCPC